jgi:hypothetical protein
MLTNLEDLRRNLMSLLRLMVLGGLATVMAAAFQAHAITLNNNCGYLGQLTDNDGCEVGSTNNDKLVASTTTQAKTPTKTPPPLQVNVDSMFDVNDWMFAEEWEVSYGAWAQGDQSTDVGLSITGTGTSGEWAITGVWDNIMLVVKGPNGSGTTPKTYVAYLLESGDTEGKFTSPFSNKNGNLQNISNITAYVRGVPEPTALALLGVALAAVAISARRRVGRRVQTL